MPTELLAFLVVWNGAIALGIALPRGVTGNAEIPAVLWALALVAIAPIAASVAADAAKTMVDGRLPALDELMATRSASRLLGEGAILAIISLARLGLWSYVADGIHDPMPGQQFRPARWIAIGLIGSPFLFPIFLAADPGVFAVVRSAVLTRLEAWRS